MEPISGESTEMRIASAGDFACFYNRHADGVVGFFARRLFDPELALELAAETFAQAFEGRTRFRGKTEAEATSWLYVIARRQLSRYFRRGRAERRALDRLGLEVPDPSEDDIRRINELAGMSELRVLVAESLAPLSLGQRDALQLRIVDELPYSEVANRLSISEATARARVSRGLRSLATALGGPTPIEDAP
jgi:RNA polymerase sigma factor (sigma-70 family)